MNYKYFLFIAPLVVVADQSFVKQPKKKQPKITAQDCCRDILTQMQNFAVIEQYTGSIESMMLELIDDYFENDDMAFFNKATSDQLKEYKIISEKIKVLQEDYKQGLHNIRNDLKQLEQKVVTTKK